MLVLRRTVSVHNSPARIRRFRPIRARHKVECSRAEQRGVDPVVYKRRSEGDIPPRLTLCRSKHAKVTPHHCVVWNEVLQVTWVFAARHSLISGEIKELVFLDRAADCSAELVAFN